MIKRIVLMAFALAALIVGAVGCHTVHGAGEDVESVGRTIDSNSP